MIPTTQPDLDAPPRAADLPARPTAGDDTLPDDLDSWWLDIGGGD